MSQELELAKLLIAVLKMFSEKDQKLILVGLKEMQAAGYGDKELTPGNIAEFYKKKVKERKKNEK